MGSAGNVGYPVTIDDNRLPCHVMELAMNWISTNELLLIPRLRFETRLIRSCEREKRPSPIHSKEN